MRGSPHARRLLLAGVLIAVLYVVAVVGYVLLGYAPLDAVYMTSLLLTTAGFGGEGSLDPAAKALTVAVAIVGVSLFLLFLALLGAALTDVEFRRATRRRRVERRIEALRDHYVVCAYGRVGRSVARELEAERQPFVVIDSKEGLEAQMAADGVLYLIGEPSSEGVLRRAGVERARALVCAVDDDATNVYIALGARSLNPGLFIVGRASDSLAAERLRRAGADRVVSPYVESGRHMALMAVWPRVLDFLDLAARGEEASRVNEVYISQTGTTVGEAAGKAVALLVRRSNGEILVHPPHEESLESGDVVLTFGELTAAGDRGRRR